MKNALKWYEKDKYSFKNLFPSLGMQIIGFLGNALIWVFVKREFI